MTAYPKTGDYPEALVKILLTILEKTPEGGSTMDDLKEAYESIRGTFPSNKTIQRAIQRLNLIFDPLVYGEQKEPGEDEDQEFQGEGLETVPPVIQPQKRYRKTFYIFTGEIGGNSMDNNIALLMTLGLYTQQKGLFKGYFETVISEIMRETMAKANDYQNIFKKIDKHIYVSGFGPSEPRKNLFKIREVMRAIRNRKRIQLIYLRVYDGITTKREVDPYGLICRFNNWYLVGFCREKQNRRVFLLDHIQRLKVKENSLISLPADFSLRYIYGKAWGVWTEDHPVEPETVRLKVKKGIAEKFKAVNFHESQKICELTNEEIEVTYQLTGAKEMIPWIMSWGMAVEVLEPLWLRETIKEKLHEMILQYSDGLSSKGV